MNLGLLLPLGDSLKRFRLHGQDARFVDYYLQKYCQNFDQVFLFSYEIERYEGLPANCELICPKHHWHRFFYGLLLPIIQSKKYNQCQMFRCFHPSAAIPAIVGKIIYGKKFIFNYNYDYQALAVLEGKKYLVPFLSLSERLAFLFCDGVFVADEKMAAHAAKFVSSAKITLIRNGADTKAFRPLVQKKKEKRQLVLSVGRLDPVKNYQQLIEAVSRLKSKPRMLIVGRGNLKQELMETARKMRVDLKIIDVVPHAQLPLIYNQASVYVQPSLSEAPVKTLLEAMSCGVPCVGTDVAGIQDVIADGMDGLLAKLDPEDIKDKIETILENEDLAKRLGVNGRNTVIEKYNLEKFLDLENKILLCI